MARSVYMPLLRSEGRFRNLRAINMLLLRSKNLDTDDHHFSGKAVSSGFAQKLESWGGHGGPPLQNRDGHSSNAGVFVGVVLRGHPSCDFLCKAGLGGFCSKIRLALGSGQYRER